MIAEEICRSHDFIHYFPSYEMVVSPGARGAYYADDSRTVNEAGVRHVMSIFAQYAPYHLQGGWNAERREAFGDAVVDTLSEYAPNLKETIVGRRVLTPLDFERKFNLTHGHIHHGEMSLDQLFAFRPFIGAAQYRTPVKGLYLCGAGTHPGGGVTGAPGFNASREVIKDLKR